MRFSIIDFLSKDDYIAYNKKLAHEIGINETILLMDLVSKHRYFEAKDRLDDDGYFYNTMENIFQDTALSRRQQDRALVTLADVKFVLIKRKGMPLKKYYKINVPALEAYFLSKGGNGGAVVQLDCTKAPNKDVQKRQTGLHETAKHD